MKDGLIAHTVYSQARIHKNYGGVVPELASRDHVRRVIPLIEETLKRSNLKIEDTDIISCTAGPGLIGSLLVGSSFAQAISWVLEIPIVPINHLEGHVLSVLLENPKLEFPFLSLLISGGHTQLTVVHDIGDYTLLGESLDDAAGEAFDKIAKLLGLSYPGGPLLESLATMGRPYQIELPKPLLNSKNLNFSFSGLKTAVFKQVKLLDVPKDKNTIADLAYASQDAITEVLISKSLKALKSTGIRDLSIVGGVAANKFLRNRFEIALKNRNNRLFIPSIELCTDNAAMIAFATAQRINKGLVPTKIPIETWKNMFKIRPRWDIKDQ